MTTVIVTREALGRYVATNAAGVRLGYGEGDDQFSSVELLLAALGGCTGIDVDYLTTRRAQPQSFEVEVCADKACDEAGNHLEDVVVTFRLRFPEGEDGDRAREILPIAVAKSHERLCTVGRTLERTTPVRTVIE